MKPLQKFGFQDSQYERPNRRWVCGFAAKGCPCPSGPTSKGQCPEGAECVPNRRGDRWYCTRANYRGGECSAGPLPNGQCGCQIPKCQPVLSLRTRRGLVVFWTTIFVLGATLYCLTSTHVNSFISPGELGFQHGILEQNCAACHTTAESGPGGWISAAFSDHQELNDSKKCSSCHSFGKNNLSPHSLPAGELEDIKARLLEDKSSPTVPFPLSFLSRLDSISPAGEQALACATCHHEHRGTDFDITSMENQQCQTCHQVKFTSFSEGHPEFKNYPYKRRTRLRFDHNSHILTYFQENKDRKSPTTCVNCHTPDPAGRMMLVKSFAETCAACHSDQISGIGRIDKGLAFIALPEVDIDTLTDRQVPIGEWPDSADGELTAFMKVLLAADPEIDGDLEKLSDVDLYDLSDSDDGTIACVGRVLWAIKNLLFELTNQGHQTIKTRLENIAGKNLEHPALTMLVEGLPVDSVTQIQKRWFPNLETEIQSFKAGKQVILRHKETTKPPVPDNETPARPDPGGSDDDILGDDDDDILLGDDDEDSDDILSDDNLLSDDGDEILGGDDDILSPDDDDILSGDDEIDSDTDFDVADSIVLPLAVSGVEWTNTGGWYSEEYALLYRPDGHGDHFIRGWLDFTSQFGSDHKERATGKLFSQLADPASLGSCMKCHSVDSSADGSFDINWFTRRPVPQRRDFTQFSHIKHFSLLDHRGCLTCHVLDRESEYHSGFRGTDPSQFSSSFKPMKRDSCTSCHVPNKAGDSCQKCHNYHIGSFPPAKVHASF